MIIQSVDQSAGTLRALRPTLRPCRRQLRQFQLSNHMGVMGIMVQHLLRRRNCTLHTADVVERLGLLVPCIAEEDRPVRPAELADWISVEAEDDPEIDKHGWLVTWDDEVKLLVRPDHDDLADFLGEQVGVRSVVQLDREVVVVEGPRLCADGLRAAVMQAVAAANRRAHDPHAKDQPGASAGGDAVAPADTNPAAHATPLAPAEGLPEEDDVCLLVTGDATSDGRRVQIWVNRNGILILPAGTIPHGPLDDSENPRFQRAAVTFDRAVELAERHAGRWLPYSSLSRASLLEPGRLFRRWTATVIEKSGNSVTLNWRGNQRHGMLFGVCAVIWGGLGKTD